MGQIHELLPRVAADIGAISKTQRNEHFRFNFRGIDDVLHAIHPALIKHGVSLSIVVSDHSIEPAGDAVRVCIKMLGAFIAPDGSEICGQAWGEALDRSDKATAKAQSGAFKSLMFLMLHIPVTADSIDDGDRGPQVESPKRAPKEITTVMEEPNGVAGDIATASLFSESLAKVANAHTEKTLKEISKQSQKQNTEGTLNDVEFWKLQKEIKLRAAFLKSPDAITANA